MKKLTEIGIKHNTDKATYHLYTDHYDEIFAQYNNPRILEIGVADFGSISTYLEYYDNPYVVGMDIEDKTRYVNSQWKFVQGDQTNINDLEKCILGEDFFDIIIEDGGHTMKQQQITFGYLINHIKSGGFYILEDLHTSLRPIYIDSDCQYTSLEMLQRIQNDESYFSNYIPKDKQLEIKSKIKSIHIIPKDPTNYNDSVTSIIQIR
jgi:demethylmacrocin O-methyltransferase